MHIMIPFVNLTMGKQRNYSNLWRKLENFSLFLQKV